MMSDGWVPAGLTMDSGKVLILYVDDPALKASRFSLSPSRSQEAMMADIKANLAKGLSVAGMHYAASAKTWFVLYTDMAAAMQDALLVSSSLEANEVKKAVRPFLNKGYLPAAVTAAEGRFFALLARFKDLAPKSWMLDFSRNEGVARALDQGVGAGSTPFGLHCSDGGCNLLFVSYAKAVGPKASATAPALAKTGKNAAAAPEGGRPALEPDPSAPLSEDQMRSIMNEFIAQ